MKTFLFDQIIFGPVISRRLGVSLGVNLLPVDSKICNYNCIYCECGWTKKNDQAESLKYSIPRATVAYHLYKKLEQMKKDGKPLDHITFAGNGEPTLHPDFPDILYDVAECRNRFYPQAQIALLSNATFGDKPQIINSLERIDKPILKIDSAIEETYLRLNQPLEGFSFSRLIATLESLQGRFIVQTMFLKGNLGEAGHFDNTSETEVAAWIDLLLRIQPREVMLYTLDRNTPLDRLEKIDSETLDRISARARQAGLIVESYNRE